MTFRATIGQETSAEIQADGTEQLLEGNRGPVSFQEAAETKPQLEKNAQPSSATATALSEYIAESSQCHSNSCCVDACMRDSVAQTQSHNISTTQLPLTRTHPR
jgi:hypothetical protein